MTFVDGWDLPEEVLDKAETLGQMDECVRCLRLVPVVEFGPNPKSPLGRRAYCRTCEATDKRARRDETRVRRGGRRDYERGPWYLYRFPGLYIGETSDLYRRLVGWRGKCHADRSPWWPLARRVVVEVYGSGLEAQEAERRAIEAAGSEIGPRLANRRAGNRRDASPVVLETFEVDPHDDDALRRVAGLARLA